MEMPEKTAFPSVAFKVASWFWKENAFVIKDNSRALKSNLNELADGTFLGFTHLTHALTTNIKSVVERVQINDQILNEFQLGLKRGQGVDCTVGSSSSEQTGYAVPICLANFQRPYCGCEGKIYVRSCPYGLLSNGKCRNSAMIKCCVESCYVDLDLVILVDGSGSIGRDNFEKEKQFIKSLVDKLEISEFETRVSIVQFDKNVYNLVDFNNLTTSNVLINDVINSMKFNGGNFEFSKQFIWI